MRSAGAHPPAHTGRMGDNRLYHPHFLKYINKQFYSYVCRLESNLKPNIGEIPALIPVIRLIQQCRNYFIPDVIVARLKKKKKKPED